MSHLVRIKVILSFRVNHFENSTLVIRFVFESIAGSNVVAKPEKTKTCQ